MSHGVIIMEFAIVNDVSGTNEGVVQVNADDNEKLKHDHGLIKIL